MRRRDFAPIVGIAPVGFVPSAIDSAGPYPGFDEPVLDDAGRVAFVATRNDLNVTATTLDGTAARDLASSDGPFRSFGPVTLNNNGVVTFGAIFDSRTAPADGGVHGIFTGPNVVADRLIGLGDALDGSTIRHLRFGHFAANTRGRSPSPRPSPTAGRAPAWTDIGPSRRVQQ